MFVLVKELFKISINPIYSCFNDLISEQVSGKCNKQSCKNFYNVTFMMTPLKQNFNVPAFLKLLVK